MTEKLTRRQQAHAFAIWRFANPLEWNCTITEIAEGTGIDPRVIGRVLTLKGWGTRIRVDGQGERSKSTWEASQTPGSLGLCGAEYLENFA